MKRGADLTKRLESAILAELRRPVPMPEMTGTVMARLGFARTSAVTARRRRGRRWIGRLLSVAGGLAAVGVGLSLHQSTARAMRPAGVSIPAAISRDLDRCRLGIDRLLQSIRALSAPPVEPTSIEAPSRPPQASGPPRETVDKTATDPFGLPFRGK